MAKLRVNAPTDEGHIHFDSAADAMACIEAMLTAGEDDSSRAEAELSRLCSEGPPLFSDEGRRTICRLMRSPELARRLEAFCMLHGPCAVRRRAERAGPTASAKRRTRLGKIEAKARDLMAFIEEDARDWHALFGIDAVLTAYPDGLSWMADRKPPIVGALADLADRAATAARATKGKPGKRPMSRGTVALVWLLRDFLIQHGVPESAAEHSRMVNVLRMVASELGVEGDPRDELRRVVAMSKAVRAAGGVLSIGQSG